MVREPLPAGRSPAFERYPARGVFVLVAALVLTAALAQSGLYARVQWWFEDAQQRWSGHAIPMDHVAVIDVDEASLKTLEPTLGAWPYDREIYAGIARFLSKNGARAVAYDILFAEPRSGDAALAAALDGRSVLATAALPGTARRARAYLDRLERLAVTVSVEAGRKPPALRSWPDLTLPLDALTVTSGARVGVISALPDPDGVLRRFHLLHEAYGQTVPGLPLATLMAAAPGQALVAGPRSVRYGDRAWPVNEDGSVELRYPGNARTLSKVPFHQVVGAVRAAPGSAHIGELFRDKLVFIGSSSAVLGDVALTPVGQIPGVQLSGLVAELLIEGRVYHPARGPIDLVLLAGLLALPLFALSRGADMRPWMFPAGFAVVVFAGWGAGMGLLEAGQKSNWLFALCGGVIAQTLVLALWLLDLYRERQRLYFEKLAAEQLSHMKTEFLNRMTHELRIPLTAVMGFNKLNQFSGTLSAEERMRNSAIVARNCEHLLELINENLDLARIQSGKVPIEAVAVDPAALCEEVVGTLLVVSGPKNIDLSLSVDPALPPAVLLDARRVRQILLNVIGNAIQHTNTGGVFVQAQWRDGRLEIDIVDTGVGLSPAEVERIFEPFQQAGMASGRTGTGLGLAITRELISRMEGRIKVESEPGRGTRFSVQLPARIAPQSVQVSVASSGVPATPLSGRVLFAEDHADLRALLGFQFDEIGIDALGVADGFGAIEAVAAGRFDLVILDLEMPRMDGYEAAAVLRARGYKGPIIALTAHDQPGEISRAQAEGCSQVLVKPVTMEVLYTTLAGLLPAAVAPAAKPAPSAPIRMETDERIRDLVLEFLANARRDVARARAAVEDGNLEFARVCGHALKGSGVSYGFEEISRLGGMLEHAARNEDPDASRRVGERLADYLDRVEPRFG